MIGGDAPEVADAESVRLCLGARKVMQIVKMLTEPSAKVRILRATVMLYQGGAASRVVDARDGMVIGQAQGAGTMVGAEPGICLRRGAIGMKGAHVGAQVGFCERLGVAMDAIKRGLQAVAMQEF